MVSITKKPVSRAYLGSADQIPATMQAARNPALPVEAAVLEFGASAALLALAVCGLLQRELDRHGVQRSIPALLRELGDVREVQVLYPPQRAGGNPTLQTTLSRMTDDQRKMFEILGLGEHTTARPRSTSLRYIARSAKLV